MAPKSGLKSKIGRILSGGKREPLTAEERLQLRSHDRQGTEDGSEYSEDYEDSEEPRVSSQIARKPLQRGARVDSEVLNIRPDVPPKNEAELLSAQRTTTGHVVDHDDQPTTGLGDSGARGAMRDPVGGSSIADLSSSDDEGYDFNRAMRNANLGKVDDTDARDGGHDFNKAMRDANLQNTVDLNDRETVAPGTAMGYPEDDLDISKTRREPNLRDTGTAMGYPEDDLDISKTRREPNLRNTVDADARETVFSAEEERDISKAMKDLNLANTVDTDIDETVAPPVVHEEVHREVTEVIQEEIHRDIHEYDHYNYIQPVVETEVLPTRHYIHDIHGNLVEIAGPVSGLEYHIERRW